MQKQVQRRMQGRMQGRVQGRVQRMQRRMLTRGHIQAGPLPTATCTLHPLSPYPYPLRASRLGEWRLGSCLAPRQQGRPHSYGRPRIAIRAQPHHRTCTCICTCTLCCACRVSACIPYPPTHPPLHHHHAAAAARPPLLTGLRMVRGAERLTHCLVLTYVLARRSRSAAAIDLSRRARRCARPRPGPRLWMPSGDGSPGRCQSPGSASRSTMTGRLLPCDVR